MSTQPLTLSFIGDAQVARQVARSFPLWFNEVEAGGDVVWVDGASWVSDTATALAHGARLVIVDRPAVTAAAVDTLAGAPVVLCDHYTHSPATVEFARQVGAVRDQIDWVELLLRGCDGTPDLWSAMVTLTACGLPVDTVPVTTPSPAMLADAHSAGARIHITGVHDGRDGVTVKAFGQFGSLELRLGDPAVATPGEVINTGQDHACLAKLEFQTSRRAALKEAYAALATGLAISSRLDDYALAVRLFERRCGQCDPSPLF